MAKVHIEKDGSVAPLEVTLGGTHDHEIFWHNSNTEQATITPDGWQLSDVFDYDQNSVVVGGRSGGSGTNSSTLTLLPHKQRLKGKLNYKVDISQDSLSIKIEE